MPHIIVEGVPGTGKTTVAMIIGRQLYGANYKANFMELNASDQRGIAVVQGMIKQFAMSSPLGADFKICFLDEADMLTSEAQGALRRTMETYASSTRFIFSVNRLEQLIDPIRSRCAIFRFGPISTVEIMTRLQQIYVEEGKPTIHGVKQDWKVVALAPEIIQTFTVIAEQCHGDMRKAVNHLQLLLSSGKPLTPELVTSVKITDYGLKILEVLKTGRFLEARKTLQEAMELGYRGRYILELMHHAMIEDTTLTADQKGKIIMQLCESDYRLTLGVLEVLSLDNLMLEVIGVMKK
jgi:replication factor C small subunit